MDRVEKGWEERRSRRVVKTTVVVKVRMRGWVRGWVRGGGGSLLTTTMWS